MTFNHALSTNNYGPFKIIVCQSPANGTHISMTSAMGAAVAGDTVYVRDGVYTENWNGKAGVTVCSMTGNEQTPTVVFNGTITYTDAGSFTISGCRLQTNGTNALVVSGGNASSVTLEKCYLNFTVNAPGILFTNSNAASSIFVLESTGNLVSSGASFYTSFCPGFISFYRFQASNSGGSAIASVSENGGVNWEYCSITSPIETDNGAGVGIFFSLVDTSAQNVIAVRANGGGSTRIEHSDFVSGTQPCITVGGTTSAFTSMISVNSSATNVITGAGTLFYNHIGFEGSASSDKINTATQVNTNSGTFLPTVAFGGASVGITYASQFGKYFRDGNLITFAFTITLTSKGTSTGVATITGLPFAAVNDGNNYDFPMVLGSASTATATGYVGDLPTGSQVLGLYFIDDATGAFTQLQDTNFTNTTVIRMQGSYFV